MRSALAWLALLSCAALAADGVVDVTLGEAIVRVKRGPPPPRVDVMTTDRACRLLGKPGIFTVNVLPGQHLVVLGTRECKRGTCTLLATGAYDAWGELAFQVDQDGRAFGPPIRPGTGAKMIGKVSTQPECSFVRPPAPPAGAGTGPDFEVVYAGIAHGAMRFQYREYTWEGLARPAFSQDFSYPLGSASVRFKAVEFDVLEARADGIRVVVRNDGAVP